MYELIIKKGIKNFEYKLIIENFSLIFKRYFKNINPIENISKNFKTPFNKIFLPSSSPI